MQHGWEDAIPRNPLIGECEGNTFTLHGEVVQGAYLWVHTHTQARGDGPSLNHLAACHDRSIDLPRGVETRQDKASLI